MNFFDAAKSIIKPHENDKLAPLTTVWGEQINADNLLSEYPRPQLRRDSFLCLNGYWDYAITAGDAVPDSFDGKILVPFSPEAPLSGVNRQLTPSEFLWYRTYLPSLDNLFDMRTLLHFGAVDYRAEVYINKTLAASHLGGYLPFHIDITDFLKDGENELLVKVQDPTDQESQPRGKQTLHRGGIFYTAQSGIWQTVWLEQVPASYIKNVWFETDYDARKVTAHITTIISDTLLSSTPLEEQAAAPPLDKPSPKELPGISLSVSCADRDNCNNTGSTRTGNYNCHNNDNCYINDNDKYNKKEILRQTLPLTAFDITETDTSSQGKESVFRFTFTLPEEHFHPWSPENPSLYYVNITLGSDSVQSYFAMRLYSIEKQPDGIPLFCLNHKPCFLMGVLDQGYWPDGLYTAPSDDALLFDITAMKKLGFNMLRKHIKVENARWYYHCDRLGMIVCQDMVNGGSKYRMPVINYLPTLFPKLSAHLKDSHYSLFSRKDAEARVQWKKECTETVEYLKFFPSIAIWVPFNEGWGQFDAARITELIQKTDFSRLIDSASGWFDQNCGDFISVHNYFRPLAVPVKKWENRAFFLSEYGGFACHIKGHSSVERVFGYKRFGSLAEFGKAYHEFIEKSLLPLKKKGLCGAVYTQVSDVEEEVNGLLTYDRKVNKLSQALPPSG
ncbi:MAG: glycoside hydrolase family 2 [Clostridium sp.]|nr:glycoside hydrolase family 2 [Clostridium sp.]